MEQNQEKYPSVEEINALPEKFRVYMHDLETRYGSRENAQTVLRVSDERDELQRRVYELEDTIKLLNHPTRIAGERS